MRDPDWKTIALERKAVLGARFEERHGERASDVATIEGAFGEDSRSACRYRAFMDDMKAQDAKIIDWLDAYVESYDVISAPPEG